MDKRQAAFLNDLASAIEQLLEGASPSPVECPSRGGPAVDRTCDAVNRLVRSFEECRQFLGALAEGRLGVEAPARNLLASPFKKMQASLRHLTWQTQQIVRGDLGQRVEFLGEFSTAFNAMIDSLREKRSVEEELRRSRKKLLDVTSALGEGLCVLDGEGLLDSMNPEAERLLGWTADELQGKSLWHAVRVGPGTDGAAGDGAAAHDTLLKTLRTGESVRVLDDRFLRRDGTRLPVSYVVTPVREDGMVTGAVIAFHDIAAANRAREALERANQLLSRQASTDALTGIPNRLLFDVALRRETGMSRRHAVPLSVIMFDIDRFKLINDGYGHAVGDLVLQEIAALVPKNLRQGDVFARWGGDEFVVLLPFTDAAGGRAMAERLRTAIDENTFSTVGKVACSFGVAQLGPADGGEAVLDRADRALYRAKGGGSDRVELAT